MRLRRLRPRFLVLLAAAVCACAAFIVLQPGTQVVAQTAKNTASARADVTPTTEGPTAPGTTAPAASDQPGSPPGKGCIVYNNITEKIVQEYGTMPTSGPAVGTIGNYRDRLYDSAGNVIGTATGTGWIVHKNPVDGHLMSYYSETVNLPGGQIRDAGIIDFSAMMAGARVSFPAVGISGRYLGMVGSRIWWGPVLHVSEHVEMVLCPWPQS
jgi:hypothetical protein